MSNHYVSTGYPKTKTVAHGNLSSEYKNRKEKAIHRFQNIDDGTWWGMKHRKGEAPNRIGIIMFVLPVPAQSKPSAEKVSACKIWMVGT